MTEQRDLFNPYPRPPLGHRDTSVAAGLSMVGRTGPIAKFIYGRIAFMEGCTCDEIEQDLGLSHQTASARINELMGLSLITDRGQRRPTRSGRKAIVWETTT